MRVFCRAETVRAGAGGLFILGRAEEQLASLPKTNAGRIKLAYLDPPAYAPASGRRKVFNDGTLAEAEYLRLMKQVLSSVKKLLSGQGTLAVHLSAGSHSKFRALLDETMGEKNFVNEIVWSYKPAVRSSRNFSRGHDTILIYRKTNRQYINMDEVALKRGAERTNHWRKVVDETGRVGYTTRSSGRSVTVYEGDKVYLTDVWDDIDRLSTQNPERTGYPGQKPEALMTRLIRAFTEENDWVLDPFSGSGSMPVAAAACNRKFIAVDASPMALYHIRRRLTALSENPSLLDTQGEVRLDFPAVRLKCVVDCDVKEANGHADAVIRGVSVNGVQTAVLSAVSGTRNVDVFLPASRAASVRFPIRLPLPDSRERVLQLTLKDGQYVYITL